MTGQELQTLQKYPEEGKVIFSETERNETLRIQYDLNTLNTKKADIDKANQFTAVQDFSGGLKFTGKTITNDYTVLASDVFIKFDTTTRSIVCTLPEASGVIDQVFKFNMVKLGGSNTVTIKTKTGETFNVTGNNTAVMNAIDDYLEIIAVATGKWLIKTNNSCTLSTV